MSQDIYLNTGELSEQQQQILESEIQDIFDWITQHDETFTQRYTITGWEDKIRRDAEYRKDLYDWIYAKQKEIQEATGEDDRIVGTFDNFERRLFPHDKVQKKKSDLDSTSQEDIMESESETSLWDSSNELNEFVVPRPEDYISTFDEQGFQDWWLTNPDVVKWKEQYINEYGVEPTLDAPIQGMPEWYDIRSAYETGITPTLERDAVFGQKKYNWGNTNSFGEVIQQQEGAMWKKKFKADTGVDPPEDMTRQEAYDTYYNKDTNTYSLFTQDYLKTKDIFDLQSTIQSDISEADQDKYGVGLDSELAKTYYAYFKENPYKIGLTDNEIQQALDKHEQEEWNRLTNFNTILRLIESKEEIAAPVLEQMFKEYGFEVGQRYIGKDYIEIIAANGESIRLSVDRDDGGSWLEGETWVRGATNSPRQNAQSAINFFNKHRQTRKPNEQKFHDAQNAEFAKDYYSHKADVSDFKQNLKEYNKLNQEFTNLPRHQRGKARYKTLKKILPAMEEDLRAQQTLLIDQDKYLQDLQTELELRDPISTEWVQGEGAFMDLFNDMYQTFQVGQTKGAMQDEVLNLMDEGSAISDDELMDILNGWEAVKAQGMPDELRDYNQDVADCGDDFFCAAKALWKNPSVATMVFAESAGQYLNPSTLELGGDVFVSTVAAATAYGGAVGGPPGAAIGFAEGIPAGAMLAIGTMSGSIEMTMTYMDLLNEATGGDMSEEAVRKVLNDPAKMQEMKNESFARGLMIGAFDTLTAGVAGSVSKALIKKPLVATTLGIGVESVGGATGEYVTQLAEGEGVSASDVLLEGVAGISSAPISIGSAFLESYMGGDTDATSTMKDFFENATFEQERDNPIGLPGTYKLNGEKVSPSQMIDFVVTGTDRQVASANIDIQGNPKLKDYTESKRDNAIQKYEVEKEIDPLIKNEEDRGALIDLELERRKLEGNDSYTAKLRLREIDGEIKNIVDKYTSKPEGRTDIEGFFDEDKKKGGRDSRLDPLAQIDGSPDSRSNLSNDLKRTQNLITSLEGLNIDFDNPKNETEKRQAAIYNEAKELETIFKNQLEGMPAKSTAGRFEVSKSAPIEIDPDGPGTLGIVQVPKRKGGGYDMQMKTRAVVKGRPLSRKVYLIDETLKAGERTSFSHPDPVRRQRTIQAAQNAFKSISKLAPNVNLLIYETHKEYTTRGNPRDSRGNYSPLTNTISLSMEHIDPSTAPHEVVHALLGNLFPDLAGKELKTKELVEAVLRIVTKRNEKLKGDLKRANAENAGAIQTEINENESFLSELRQHVDMYKGKRQAVKNEEHLAQALALIASRYPKLPPQAKSKVREFIEWVLKKLGLGKFIDRIYKKAPDQVIADALNTIADKMRTGEVMVEEDVQVMDLTPEQETRREEIRGGEADERTRYREKIEDMKRKAGGVENMSEDELVILEGLELELAALEKGEGVPAGELVVEGIETETQTPTYKEPDSVIEDTKESRLEGVEQKIEEEPSDSSKDFKEPEQDRGSELIEIIQTARDNNFSDIEITDYLVRVKNFKPSEVKKALEISIDDTTLLPKSFAEVEGGIESGVRLFKRVNKYKDSLVARNKQAKKKLTQEQITDKVIEYLEQQPEFKREGGRKELSPLQAKMQVDLQKTLGTPPTRDMGRVLRESKKFIKGVEEGKKSLQAIKQDLRNFMRKTLPIDTYTKPEVLKMVRKIEEATRSSIRNVMNEVIDFTNEKVATSLEKDIDSKLNAKYEVKLSGRKKATKIDADAIEQMNMIKKERASKIATPNEVYETNAKLAAEYNDLSKEINPTDEQIRRMAILEIAMKLNNASLMENSDINKVQELSDVNNSLEEIIVGGRQRLEDEIQATREEYERQLSIAWEAITKEKVDASTEEGKNQIEKTTNYLVTKDEIKATQNVLRKILRGVGNKLSDIFVSHEALDGLMDKITLMPGELFGGPLKDLVYERVNEGTRLYKARKMAVEKLIIDKIKSLYGKKWRSKMIANRKVVYNKIYKDGDAVLAAQKKYNADKTSANKEALKRVELENNIQGVTYASQEQLYYLYNQFKDPALHPTFKKMWGDNYKKVAEQIENALNPEVKKFADWQVDELFPALYPHYNKTYRKIYRTNMPQNEHYAGTLYREGVKSEPVDLLSGDNQFYTSIGESSTIARVKNTNPIQSMIGTDALMTYVTDMEYFAAMAEPLRDIDKLFTNDHIKKAIVSIHGKNTYSLIKSAIQKLANRGVRSHDMNKYINSMNNVFIYSRLGFNPTITIKQLTSMFTYANDIGIRNWMKYGVKNLTELKKLWKEVQSNSAYLQDRKYNGIMRHIESYTEKQMQSLVPSRHKQFMVNFLMWFTKFGDMGAIMLGGLPNYSYYKAQYKKKNPRATEQEAIDYAIRKFESDTKRTQQSVDLQDKDVYQTSNPLVRAMNMFLTTPKQYLRKEIQASRNLWRIAKARDFKAGKGSIKELIRTFLMYHVFLPVLFQFVAMGFKIDEEDDWWDLARAAVIGNLNALFIIGDLFEYLGDTATGKQWAGDNDGALRILTIAGKITQDFNRMQNAKTQETKDKYLKKIILETLTLTGLPAHQVDRFIENYGKVMTGDVDSTHELILRLLNYSQYQIEGGGKEKKTKKKRKGKSGTTGTITIDIEQPTLEGGFEQPKFEQPTLNMDILNNLNL